MRGGARPRPGLTVIAAILATGMVAAAWAAQAATFRSQVHDFRIVQVATGLDKPWGMAWLPDGRMLVTEKSGRLRLIGADGDLDPKPIGGTPKVFARGQGGLLDVTLHPDYKRTGWIYLSYSAPGSGGASTAVMRARLSGRQLADQQVIFEADKKSGGGRHFGSRIRFGPDGLLYVTTGERGQESRAQDLGDAQGKVLRLRDDGSIPKDNPFVGEEGARPEIFTYGNRNPQGLAIQPGSGLVWTHEHGPQGGDEINILRAGANYGWPKVTYGEEYGGGKIGVGTAAPGVEQPVLYWTPSIAPSGMEFYDGDAFPQWKGDLFAGSLKFGHLVRVDVEGTSVRGQEVLFKREIGRVRDVRQGPDGLLYLLNDDRKGGVFRIEPVN